MIKTTYCGSPVKRLCFKILISLIDVVWIISPYRENISPRSSKMRRDAHHVFINYQQRRPIWNSVDSVNAIFIKMGLSPASARPSAVSSLFYETTADLVHLEMTVTKPTRFLHSIFLSFFLRTSFDWLYFLQLLFLF